LLSIRFIAERICEKAREAKRAKRAKVGIGLFAFFASPADLQKTNPQRNYEDLYLDRSSRPAWLDCLN
jgi:hypothetical protein